MAIHTKNKSQYVDAIAGWVNWLPAVTGVIDITTMQEDGSESLLAIPQRWVVSNQHLIKVTKKLVHTLLGQVAPPAVQAETDFHTMNSFLSSTLGRPAMLTIGKGG